MQTKKDEELQAKVTLGRLIFIDLARGFSAAGSVSSIAVSLGVVSPLRRYSDSTNSIDPLGNMVLRVAVLTASVKDDMPHAVSLAES